jgi:hypothetical protein
MGASLDSREVFVPGTVVRPEGVRLSAPVPLVVAWPAALIVLEVLLLVFGGQRAWGAVTTLVPLLAWAGLCAPTLLQARRKAVDPARFRPLAGVSLVLTLAVPVLASAAIFVASRTADTWPGGYISAVQWTAIALTVFLGWCAGWLRRLVRATDPATPPAVVPPIRVLTWLPKGVDFGEDGLRFPKALPWLALPLSVLLTFVVVWLASRGRAADVPFGPHTPGWTVALSVAGGAWLPFVGRALGRGMRPGQIRAVGLAYLVGALATVVLFTMASWNTNPVGPLIGVFAALFMIVPGLRLRVIGKAYAASLTEAETPPTHP